MRVCAYIHHCFSLIFYWIHWFSWLFPGLEMGFKNVKTFLGFPWLWELGSEGCAMSHVSVLPQLYLSPSLCSPKYKINDGGGGQTQRFPLTDASNFHAWTGQGPQSWLCTRSGSLGSRKHQRHRHSPTTTLYVSVMWSWVHDKKLNLVTAVYIPLLFLHFGPDTAF